MPFIPDFSREIAPFNSGLIYAHAFSSKCATFPFFIGFVSNPKNGRAQIPSSVGTTTNGHQDRTTDYADDTDSQNAENQITNDERMTKLD